MVKCSVCRKEFIGKKVFKFINKKLKSEKTPTCQVCKRKITVEKFKDCFANISK